MPFECAVCNGARRLPAGFAGSGRLPFKPCPMCGPPRYELRVSGPNRIGCRRAPGCYRPMTWRLVQSLYRAAIERHARSERAGLVDCPLTYRVVRVDA